MDISRVKREKLPASGLVKTAFYVWGKMFLPSLKIFALALLFGAAAMVLWIVFTQNISGRAVLRAAAAVNITLLVIYFILTLAVFRLAYDIITTKRPSVIDAIAQSLRAVPNLLIAAAAAIAVLYLIILIKPGGGAAFFAVYVMVASVWGAAALLYLGFYTMALLLRGSGIFATFKFCFLMLKGKWGGAFFRTLLGLIITFILFVLLAGLLLGGIYLLFAQPLDALWRGAADMGFFALFYHAARIWLPALLAIILSTFANVLALAFLSSYMTALFLNTELPEEADPAADKVEILPAHARAPVQGEPPEFTEFFRNSKPVDVTERIIIADDLPAMSPATREEVLREFGKGEEEQAFKSVKEILSVKRSEDDVLEVLNELQEKEIPPDEDLPSSIIRPGR